MNPSFTLPAISNNSTSGQLLGAIGAGDTSISLKTGHGAFFPTILRGDCSSTGDATLLNDTGALGGISVGDFLYNLTDGSWAIVTSIAGAPNSVTTTPLDGGSDNIWQSGDIWVRGMFIATLIQYDADGETVLKRERIRVVSRVSDALIVERGYDGDTAQTFLSNDYVQILIEKSQIENIQKAIRNIHQHIHYLKRGTPYGTTTTGTSNNYIATIDQSITAYSDILNLEITCKASFMNTGSATLNINGLGSVNIYKQDGSTALESGDIRAGQIFTVSYDGTNFQMTSPSAISSFTMPSGSIMPYAGISEPSGWLFCAGQAVSRSTYQNLFSAISPTKGTFTITIASPGVITLNNHGFLLGDAVYFTTTGALPTGLSQNTRYFVTATSLGANTFTVSSSFGGAAINTTGSQSGTHTCVANPFGLGNGTTTFNVPDMRGRIGVGRDNLGGTSANRVTDIEADVLGQSKGQESQNLAHTHTVPGVGNITDNGSGRFMLSSTTVPTTSSLGVTNIMNPYLAINYIIKT